MELRCDHKLHAILTDNDHLEIRCKSRFCGAGDNVVVIHQFDLHTGGVETRRYKEPPQPERR